MATLDAYRYADPAKVAEINEAKEQRANSCKGCVHFFRLWQVPVCACHEGKAGSQVYRCDDYERGENGRG